MSALDKVLKNHARSCAYYVFSGDRHCSCGRDAAIKELADKDAELAALRAQVAQLEARLAECDEMDEEDAGQ